MLVPSYLVSQCLRHSIFHVDVEWLERTEDWDPDEPIAKIVSFAANLGPRRRWLSMLHGMDVDESSDEMMGGDDEDDEDEDEDVVNPIDTFDDDAETLAMPGDVIQMIDNLMIAANNGNDAEVIGLSDFETDIPYWEIIATDAPSSGESDKEIESAAD